MKKIIMFLFVLEEKKDNFNLLSHIFVIFRKYDSIILCQLGVNDVFNSW